MNKIFFWLIYFILLIVTISGVFASLDYYDTAETQDVGNYTCITGGCTSITTTVASKYEGSYGYQVRTTNKNWYNNTALSNTKTDVIGEAVSVDIMYYSSASASVCGTLGLQTIANDGNQYVLQWTDECFGVNGGRLDEVNVTGGSTEMSFAGNTSCSALADDNWYNVTVWINKTAASEWSLGHDIKDTSGTLLCSYGRVATLDVYNDVSWTWIFGGGSGAPNDFYFDDINLRGAGVAPASNFSVTLKDLEDNSINNFTAVINGTDYTTTTGTTTSEIVQGSGSVSVAIESAIDSNGYFYNQSYGSIDTSSNFEATGLYQADISSFILIEIASNNTLSGAVTLDNGSDAPSQYLFGSYNFTFENVSYFDKVLLNQSLPVLFNGSVTISDIFSAVINITAVNAFTNTTISDFSGTLTSNDYNWSYEYNSSNNYSELPAIDGNWTVFIEAPGFAIEDSINYQNFTINNSIYVENYTFGLYTNNSILFNIFDALTLNYVAENVNISMETTNKSYSFNTSNGILFVDQIFDGTYTTTVKSTTYDLAQIFITVLNNSYQLQNIYLTTGAIPITFFVRNNLGENIEGATATLTTDINGTPVVVAQETTDFAGIFQVDLNSNNLYSITLTHSDYETWTGDVKPTQTEYIINMEDVGGTSFVSIYEDVQYAISMIHPANSSFVEFYLEIFSNIGSLQFYGLSYNSTVLANQTGSTGGGTEFINVTATVPWDEILTITYWFKSTNQSQLTTWDQEWLVSDFIPTNATLTGGLFDGTETIDPGTKVLMGIGIILALIVLGGLLTATLMGASVAGMAGLGVAAFAGFLPLPISVVTLIILSTMLVADALGGAR